MTLCEKCGLSRWIANKSHDKIPRKQFHYFSLGLRLQRLYTFTTTASHMRWHAEHHSEDGEMCHPSTNEAWLTLSAINPNFVRGIRNMRLGLRIVGFNPYGSSGQQYSYRPVILTPYNIPPLICMKIFSRRN